MSFSLERLVLRKVIQLSKAVYTKYLKRDGEVRCRNDPCQKELSVGEMVLSRITCNALVSPLKTRLYCLKCAEELNLL